MLIDTISEDLDELFENRCLTAIALLRKPGRVVVVAVYISFVFVIAIRGTEDCRTDTAREVLNVIFAIQCGDVRASQCAAAGVAKEIQPSEIVGLAEWVLVRRLIWHREEL